MSGKGAKELMTTVKLDNVYFMNPSSYMKRKARIEKEFAGHIKPKVEWVTTLSPEDHTEWTD